MDYSDSEVERVCEKISIAFANAIDRCDYDAVIALFARDGILDRWAMRSKATRRCGNGSTAGRAA